MNRIAVIIKHEATEDSEAKCEVKDIVEFESLGYISEMKVIMDCYDLIPVNDEVQIGDMFDEKTRDFLNKDGQIVFSAMTDLQRIEKLEHQLEEARNELREARENGITSNKDLSKMTRDEQYDYIINQIKSDCNKVITNGFDAYYPIASDIPDPVPEGYWDTKERRHYSLSTFKQQDLRDRLLNAMRQKDETVLWRDDSLTNLEEYLVKDFVVLANRLLAMIDACKVKSDFLEQLVKSKYDAGEVFTNVNWNTKLPNDLRDQAIMQINKLTRMERGRYLLRNIPTINYSDGTITCLRPV